MRKLLAVCAILCSIPAAAQDGEPPLPPPLPVAVEVSASSARKDRPASGAVDGDPESPWCIGKKKDPGNERLTISLPEPAQVDKVVIASQVSLRLEIHDGNGDSTVELTPVDGAVEHPLGSTVTSLAIGFAGATAKTACVHEVALWRGDQELLLLGAGADAAKALVPALEQAEAALVDCKAAEIGKVFKTPLVQRRELCGSDGTSHKKRRYKRARDLARACAKQALPVFFMGSITCVAVGSDRVRCVDDRSNLDLDGTFARTDIFELVWKKGAWRIVAIDSFENYGHCI